MIRRIIENVAFALSLCNADGQIVFNTQTGTAKFDVAVWEGIGEIALTIDRLDLAGGQYFISVGAFAPDWSKTYDYHWKRYPFSIHWTPPEDSLLTPPLRWTRI